MNAPRSREGRIVASAINRQGIWKRVGAAGLVSGLDLTEAMLSVPPRCDPEIAYELFVVAEAAFVSALLDREDKDDGR